MKLNTCELFLKFYVFSRNLSDHQRREAVKFEKSDKHNSRGFHQSVFLRTFDLSIKMPEWKHRKKILKYHKNVFTLEVGGKV